MKLDKKKEMAAKTLGVGISRIVFEGSMLNEISEAITRQDIRDLVAAGAIRIKDRSGKRKNRGVKKRTFGNIRKKVKKRKEVYVKATRKLRIYARELKKQGRISNDAYHSLRRRIKARAFRDKRHMQEQVQAGMIKKTL